MGKSLVPLRERSLLCHFKGMYPRCKNDGQSSLKIEMDLCQGAPGPGREHLL